MSLQNLLLSYSYFLNSKRNTIILCGFCPESLKAIIRIQISSTEAVVVVDFDLDDWKILYLLLKSVAMYYEDDGGIPLKISNRHGNEIDLLQEDLKILFLLIDYLDDIMQHNDANHHIIFNYVNEYKKQCIVKNVNVLHYLEYFEFPFYKNKINFHRLFNEISINLCVK